MNWFTELLDKTPPLKRELLTVKTKHYWVNHMNPAIMGRAHSFGCAYKQEVYVRADLSIRIKRFVISHEIYHLNDKHAWLGWLGGEIRANLVAGMKDPVGLLLTIKASLTAERLAAYWRALRRVGVKPSSYQGFPLN